MAFKDILKELRYEYSLSQKDVARECDLSPQCISQLEMGTRNPTGTTLVALANYFDCTIDYLMGRGDELDENIFSTNKITPQEITPREKNLLINFRKLPPELQHRAEFYMEKLLDIVNEEQTSDFTQAKNRRISTTAEK